MKNLKEKPKEQSVLFSSRVTLQKEDLGKMDTLWSIVYTHEYCWCWSWVCCLIAFCGFLSFAGRNCLVFSVQPSTIASLFSKDQRHWSRCSSGDRTQHYACGCRASTQCERNLLSCLLIPGVWEVWMKRHKCERKHW